MTTLTRPKCSSDLRSYERNNEDRWHDRGCDRGYDRRGGHQQPYREKTASFLSKLFDD